MPRPRKMKQATRKQGRVNMEGDDIDIREDGDLEKFSEFAAKHPVVVIFIYADWCGHCTTYKPIWDRLKGLRSRRVPMARMNEAMLKKSVLSDAKINGFPSVVIRGKDNSLASFTDSDNGQSTNSIPNMRDEKVMRTLLEANPEELLGRDEDDTAVPTIKAEQALRKAAKRAIRDRSKKFTDDSTPSPPSVRHDRSDELPLMRQTRRKHRGKVFGGSLYKSLMSI